jgi:hypothetical protein
MPISGSLFAKQVQQDHPAVMMLDWEDLIPENERNQLPEPRKINHDAEDTPPQPMFGGVRHELDGKFIKMPGFVIPLEGDNEKIYEFLLVPFLGACIHVPPPPPNQIVYVKFQQGTPLKKLWDVVYVTGYLKTETINADLGEAAYVIYGENVEHFEQRSS